MAKAPTIETAEEVQTHLGEALKKSEGTDLIAPTIRKSVEVAHGNVMSRFRNKYKKKESKS